MEKIGQMLKSLVPKFRPNLPARLKDIAEKQVPAMLKPIAGEDKKRYQPQHHFDCLGFWPNTVVLGNPSTYFGDILDFPLL